MARMFDDADGDLILLDGHVVSVLGYGIQGAAQAQNLRLPQVSPQRGRVNDRATHHRHRH